MRALKRRLSNIVYRTMLDDAMAAQATGPGGQRGSDSDSSATGSQPNTGSSDKPLRGPSHPSLERPCNACLDTEGSQDRDAADERTLTRTPGGSTGCALRENDVVYPRALTTRERDVLVALLAVDFEGVDRLRRQAADVQVLGKCGCGCPSIDFFAGPNEGMEAVVDAEVRDSSTFDGLFLYTIESPGFGEVLGGIEWQGQDDTTPAEFPPPKDLRITPGRP